MLLLFFKYMPWLESDNIEKLTDLELIQKYPIPKNAKAFSIEHGIVIYYPETTEDNPKKFYSIISFFILGLIYIILSSRCSEKIKNENKKRLVKS